MCSLSNGRRIVIKKVDKGSCVVVMDHKNYVADNEKQLRDENVEK